MSWFRRPVSIRNVSILVAGQKAPAATALPSPSFLSTTASTPCASYIPGITAGVGVANGNRNLSALLYQLGDSSPVPVGEAEAPIGPESPTLNVLKDWISHEVERQWTTRASNPTLSPNQRSPFGSPLSQQSFEEVALLPQSVWQSLKGQSPMGKSDWTTNNTSCEVLDQRDSGPESPYFVDAVRRLIDEGSNVIVDDPAASAKLLLETLGELAKTPRNMWPSERPPMCRTPFS